MTPLLEPILTSLRSHKPALMGCFPVHRMAIFGSVVRGEATEDSDVDILVEVDPSIGWGIVDLADRLEQILGHRVDLVSRRAVRPSLWERIEPELIDV